MSASEITITPLCCICHGELKEERFVPFPFHENGDCCEGCSEKWVMKARQLCAEQGLFYITHRKECLSFVRHLKKIGLLPRKPPCDNSQK